MAKKRSKTPTVQVEQSEQSKVDRRLQCLADMVAPLGDSFRERIHAGGLTPLGLLPEKEALSILRDMLVPLCDGLKEYSPPDPREGDFTSPGDTYVRTFAGHTIPEVSAADWERIKAVRVVLSQKVDINGAKLPAPVLQGHRTRCKDRDDAADPCRCPDLWSYGLLVRRDLGEGLVIEREYGV